MSKLRCISYYRNDPRNVIYVPGDIVSDEELVAFLLTDSPDSFEPVEKVKAAEPENKAVEEPPKNKAASSSRKRSSKS